MLACAASCVAACTGVVDSVVDSRYGEYNRQTDYAKNEAILLNIIRASEYQPLNFMSFQPYTGQATVSTSLNSPAFIEGPYRTVSQRQFSYASGALSGSASANGTISLTMLDTQNFYQAVLDPVDFTDLNTFQRQGYPRELLFRLFTNSVTLRPVDPKKRQYSVIVYNDPIEDNQCIPLLGLANQLYGPNPKDFQTRICFDNLVEFALLSGLSSETRAVNNPGASQTKASPGGAGNPNQSGNSQNPQTILQGRLCFDPALANRYQLQYYRRERNNIESGRTTDWTISSLGRFMHGIRIAQYHPVCGQTTGLDQWPTTTSTTAGPVKAAAPKPAPPAPPAAPDHATPAAPATPAVPAVSEAPAAPAHPAPAAPAAGVHTATAANTNNKPGVAILKVIVPERTGSPVWDIHTVLTDQVEIGTRSTFGIYNFLGKLLHGPQSNLPGLDPNKLIGSAADDTDPYILTIVKGRFTGCFTATEFNLGLYCVPIEGAENTKSAFSILSQLLALKTTTGDLQLTPTLRLVP